jgi:hypothetical protein
VGRLVSRVERCKGGLGCGSSSSSNSGSGSGGSGNGCAIMGLGRCHFTSAIADDCVVVGKGSSQAGRSKQEQKQQGSEARGKTGGRKVQACKASAG